MGMELGLRAQQTELEPTKVVEDALPKKSVISPPTTSKIGKSMVDHTERHLKTIHSADQTSKSVSKSFDTIVVATKSTHHPQLKTTDTMIAKTAVSPSAITSTAKTGKSTGTAVSGLATAKLAGTTATATGAQTAKSAGTTASGVPTAKSLAGSSKTVTDAISYDSTIKPGPISGTCYFA